MSPKIVWRAFPLIKGRPVWIVATGAGGEDAGLVLLLILVIKQTTYQVSVKNIESC